MEQAHVPTPQPRVSITPFPSKWSDFVPYPVGHAVSPACATHGPVPPGSFGRHADPDPQPVPAPEAPHALAEGAHEGAGGVPTAPGVHVPPFAVGGSAWQKAG
jgi:hypothetical protein